MRGRRLRFWAFLSLSCTAQLLIACAQTIKPGAIPTATPTAVSAPLGAASPTSIAEQRMDAHGIAYVFRASRLTNLAWQLDCLAGFGRCSQPAYEALWQVRLQNEPELKRSLARWGDLRRGLRAPVGDTPQSYSLLPLPQLKADLWQRVRFASVTATDEVDYVSKLYALTDVQSADALRAVVARFDLVFDDIWAQALPVLKQAMANEAKLLQREDVALSIERVWMVAFCGKPLTARSSLLRNWGTCALDRALPALHRRH